MMKLLRNLLACPFCKGEFCLKNKKLICKKCGFKVKRNKYGYYEFIKKEKFKDFETTTEEYYSTQIKVGERQFHNYLKKLFLQRPFKRVLDVGCGAGVVIKILIDEGYEAYGIDFPHLSKFWKEYSNPSSNFFCADARNLPFKDNIFDIVFSFGVIEHIGTTEGRVRLKENYKEEREKFAESLARITKQGGRIFISCPNKSFPIDVQHWPDEKAKIRKFIFEKTKLNFHKPWGKYHLLSYKEIKELFLYSGIVKKITPLPLYGFFSFTRFEKGFLKLFKKFAEFYIRKLPRELWVSFLNPYILVEMEK